MATKKTKRFQEGGISDKERGLEASKDDKVGFFERLRMGNIDQEGSEAYNRFGAGRGKMERTPEEKRTPTPVIPEKPEEVRVTPLGEESRNNAVIQGRPQQSGDAAMAEMYQGPRTTPVKSSSTRSSSETSPAAKAAAKRLGLGQKVSSKEVADAKAQLGIKNSSAKSSAYPMTGTQPTTKTYSRSGGPSADELANYKPSAKKTGADAIPGQNVKPVVGEKIEPMSDAERNINNMMMGAGAGAGIFGLYKKGKSILNARKAAKAGAKKREALKRDVEEGIDRNLADEFKDLASSAAKTPAKKTKATSKKSSYGSAREDAKADKAYKNLRDSDFTRSPRDDKTLNPMAWMSGPKGMADNFKKGGKVKSMKMSSGGSTSPASKRADGIATRGKTRCKIR